MLNRVREGKHTEVDLAKLKEKIRPYGHSDLEEVRLYIVCKKRDCARIMIMSTLTIFLATR